jgi:dipeptidyl aminopeptidase/acylaminoacyl peptidase
MQFAAWLRAMTYAHAFAVAMGGACGDEPDPLLSEPLAEAFGTPPLIRGLRLSPDGTKISFLQSRPDGGLLVRVFDTSSQNAATAFASGPNGYDITACQWANDERLLCSLRVRQMLDTRAISWERLAAVNADGSKPLLLLTRERAVGNIRLEDHLIDWLRDDPQHVLLGVRISSSAVPYSQEIPRRQYVPWYAGAATMRLNIYDNDRRIEPQHGSALSWVTDGRGTPRLGQTLRGRRRTWWLQNESGRSTLREADLGQQPDSFSPVSFDGDTNEVLYFDRHDGRMALFALNPQDDRAGRLVYSRADTDLTGVYRVGKHDRVVAAAYVDDRPRLHFFDPKTERIRGMLSADFPGMTVAVIDEDWSERNYLVFAYADRDPGTYYLFDSANLVLTLFGRAYPALSEPGLAATQAVSYAAADGHELTSHLTLPSGGLARAAVVLPRGGPPSRGYWEFDLVAQYLAAKGYAVLRSSYRGSSGPQAISDLSSGARYLVESGIVGPGRICLVGWSDGGYPALLSAREQPESYRCVVGISAVVDPPAALKDATDSASDTPDGGPLADRAAEIALPTLLFHARGDANTASKRVERLVEAMRKAYRDVTLIQYEHAESDIGPARYRTDMLTRLGTFLGDHLGHDAGHFHSRLVSNAEPVDVVEFGTDALATDGHCMDRRFQHLDGRWLTAATYSGRPWTEGEDATDCRRLFNAGEIVLPEVYNRSGDATAEHRTTFFVDPSEQDSAAIVRFDDNATDSAGAGVAVVYARPGYHTVSVRLSAASYRCVVAFRQDGSLARLPAFAGHYYRIQTDVVDGALLLRVTDASEDRVVLEQREPLLAACAEGKD